MDQSDVVNALEHGRVAGIAPRPQRIDTHLSHVFLTHDGAYKMKRAVRYPFVDFSTLEKRQTACEAELSANKGLAADLYLSAAAITRTGSTLRLDGDGQIVEWLVCMRRFDQSQQFDELAKRGALSRTMVERTAKRIAAFHAQAPAIMTAGHSADYARIIAGLSRTEDQSAQALGLHAASPDLLQALDRRVHLHAPQIEQRRQAGKVKRGHGDLHLRNICLFEGKPLCFDALEFDDRLATADILYDLAFLLMDLRRCGLDAHANAAMNAYWDASGEDEAAPRLLPFFMGLRAAVRMAVDVAAGDLAEAQTFRHLGMTLLQDANPVLVVIGGLSGTGKSTVARELAPLLPGAAGARWLRTDVLRKSATGIGAEQPAAPAAYEPEARAQTYRRLVQETKTALLAGVSIVADATFQDAEARDAIVAASGAAPVHAFWLEAPLEVRLGRVAARRGDPSDAGEAVAAAQKEPTGIGLLWTRIDACAPAAQIAHDIARRIA